MIHPRHGDRITAVDRPPTNPLHALAGITVPEWMLQALCAEVDTDMFFPDKGGSTRPAKAVCAACPVRDECLAYALAIESADNPLAIYGGFGIWGGLSAKERRRLLADRGQEPAA